MKRHELFLRALVVLGLIVFGVFLAAEGGFVRLTLESDRSYISFVILGLYLLATVHWLVVARRLSRERDALARLDAGEALDGGGDVARFVQAVADGRGDPARLLETLGDRVHNRHATGHFASDVLLKLGLLGTIVGFILMLLPVGELEAFDPAAIRQLLGQMSGGMAVALYTTLAGLVTSTLLKLQYHMLDSSAAELITDIGELVELRAGDAA